MKRVFANFQLIKLFSVFILLLVLNQSCKKNTDVVTQHQLIQKHPLSDKFFIARDTISPVIAKIIEKIKNRSDVDSYVNDVLESVGIPLWDKALITANNDDLYPTNGVNSGNYSNESSNAPIIYAIIPISPYGTREVDGFFGCKIQGGSVHINFIKEKEYKKFGFNNSATYSADKVVGLVMYLQNKVFATKSFVVQDGRLFSNNPNADSLKKRIILLKKVSNNSQGSSGGNNIIINNYTVPIVIEECYEITCTVGGQLNDGGVVCSQVCVTTVIWGDESLDPPGGNGSGNGGSNGNGNAGDPGGGGGGGGGLYGGGSNEPPSTSVNTIVSQQLVLNPAQSAFMQTLSPAIATEMYIYLTTNAVPEFTLVEKENIIRSHINYLMTNTIYKNFCESQVVYTTSQYYGDPNFLIQSTWFAPDRLINNQTLYQNIINLRLAAEPAFYLLNNPTISSQINQFLIANNNSEEAKIAAKGCIDQFLNNALNDFGGIQHIAFIQQNMTNCCPVQFIAFMSAKAAFIQLEHPNWSYARCYLEAYLEIIHDVLDGVGLVPVVGEVADVANGIIYSIQGQGANAALSFIATIPIGGWLATSAKWARKAITLSDGTKTALNWYKRTDGFISFGKPNSSQFRKLLGLAAGDPRQAHHIIPWELCDDIGQEVIQKAASARFPFHVQDILNGIPLTSAQHLGSHPQYTERVKITLQKIKDKHGANLTPEIAYQEIVDLTNRIKAIIAANPNISIENIIF